MRLFGLVDGAIDRRDRPHFFGDLFDRAWQTPQGILSGPVCVVKSQSRMSGIVETQSSISGIVQNEACFPRIVASQDAC